MTIGAFIFRDVLQYILPTILGACLFLPYFSFCLTADKAVIEGLILGSVLIGYVASTPIHMLAMRVWKTIPFARSLMKYHKNMADWMNNNWDYGKFFYNMPNEHREYIYVTAAYMQFYFLVAFYFLIYSVVNLIVLLSHLKEYHYTQWLEMLLNVRIQLISGHYCPVIYLIIISIILSVFLFKDYLTEYKILFFPSFQHDQFARKYQKEGFGIAKSIWGQVTSASVTKKFEIELLVGDQQQVVFTTESNEEGYFQFLNKFDECKDKKCVVRANLAGIISEKEFTVTDTTVPVLDLHNP